MKLVDKSFHVLSAGMELAYLSFANAVSRLPVPSLWAVLFFLMMLFLGLNSQVLYVTYSMQCLSVINHIRRAVFFCPRSLCVWRVWPQPSGTCSLAT